MRQDTPSATALLIARSTVLSFHDPNHRALIPPESLDLAAAALREVSPLGAAAVALAGRLGPVRRAAALAERTAIPGLRLHYLLRKKRIAELCAALPGLEQIVVLGAGFDALASTLVRSRPAITAIEIDHPATQRVKARALGDRPANLHLVPLDLSAGSTAEILARCGAYSASRRTFFVAEGLFMYLPLATVGGILRCLQAHPRGTSAFALTYMTRDARGRPAFRDQGPLVEGWLRRRSEPFVWGSTPAEVDAFIAGLGFAPAEHETGPELRRRYLPDREDLRSAEGENLCHVRW